MRLQQVLRRQFQTKVAEEICFAQIYGSIQLSSPKTLNEIFISKTLQIVNLFVNFLFANQKWEIILAQWR